MWFNGSNTKETLLILWIICEDFPLGAPSVTLDTVMGLNQTLNRAGIQERRVKVQCNVVKACFNDQEAGWSFHSTIECVFG